MKLTACTLLYTDYATLDETMRRFAKFGYQGVDLWGYSPHLDCLVDRNDRRDIKKLAGDLGLDLVAISINGGPLARQYNFSHSLEWVRQETIDYYKITVDVAAEMGIPYINMISGHMVFGTDKREAWKWNIDGMKQVCDHAAASGVTMCLHTAVSDVTRVLVYLDDSLMMMDEIDSPGCKIMIDTSDQAISETHMGDAVRKVADHLMYIHASDTAKDGTFAHEPIGTGTIHWPLFLQTLKEVGYNGAITVQLDSGSKPVDADAWYYESAKYLKGIMKECGVWED